VITSLALIGHQYGGDQGLRFKRDKNRAFAHKQIEQRELTNMTVQLTKTLVFAGLLAVSTSAFAETTETQAAETTTKIEEVMPNAPVKKEGEASVDEVITNRKLRAETGSKNLYSFSAALGYNGGTVNNPMSDVRPDISSTVFDPAQPALSGSIGGKYKISELQTLSLDVGVLIRKPFHTDATKSFRERSTVSNPSLTYQVVYQAAGIQNVTQVYGALTTDEAYRAIGDFGTIGFGQTAIYDFGGSKFSAGLAFDASYTAFDKNEEELRSSQSDFQFGFYPFAELVLNDSLNLRTVFRPFTFRHVRAEAFGNVVRDVNTQSFGLGISVTRDIYLYPNIQFVLEDVRAERTNVALSANINI
jgi:hypothetical protein